MTDAGDALAPGTRLEEFEIKELLGAGGFGVTYLARDLSPLDAWRAVKEYLPRDWGTRRGDGTVGPRTGANAEDYGWGLERFLEEARILARFKHPNIVHVYQVFEARGTAYMVTEYVEGRTLSAEVKEGGPFPESRVREVLAALTDGLSAVHASDLLHRDIKPENVMVRPDGTPVLIDFGAARQAMGRHSRSVTALLTPGYAPIEQYSARGNQGPWTDIYALGAVAYFALGCGVPEDATERVSQDRVPSLAAAVPGRVSRELSAAIDAALAVDRRDRPQSLAEWAALLEGRPAVAVPAGLERVAAVGWRPASGRRGGDVSSVRSRRPASGRPWLAGAAAAAGLGVAALAMALLGPWSVRLFDERAVPGGTAAGGETVPGTTEAGRPTSGEPGASGPSDETRLADGAPEPLGAGEETAVADRGEAAAPPPSPAEAESALGLDRAARRVIQEGLAASGFDAGAADGLFGPGTRRALREWQSARGVPATGYLDAASTAALRTAGQDAARVEAQRQAEREAEAARQAEREAEAARQAEREAEAARQAEREAEAARQAEREAEAARQAEREAEAARQAEREAEAARQVERDAARAPGTVFRDCSTCPELVVIPSGEFRMGSPASEEGRWDDGAEEPLRRVRVERFALGRYEVTFEDYERFVWATGRGRPDHRGWGRGRRPAINVSWEDATAYSAWLSAETGLRYRLPSEAEWEYAARAGTETRYSWGNAIGRNRANCLYCGSRWGGEQTAPVGSFAANAWGLHDVHGNVWEWVEDCWHDSYRGAPSDGRAWTTGGDCSRRVLRGGSWFNNPGFLRVAFRVPKPPFNRDHRDGFRVARTLD